MVREIGHPTGLSFPWGKRNLQSIFILCIIILLSLLVSTHVGMLDKIPAGLFLDESSIGYNAISIMNTGRDEHGIRYPIYFESVGDYKNPIYIYSVAAVFKLFGISEFTLRFTSVIFYFAALTITVLLIRRMFDHNKVVLTYMLVSFGFLPLLFTISRLSFEVITQLTWVSATNFCIWLTFHEADNDRFAFLKSLGCGFVIGTSIYTYSTARFLSFLALFSLWMIYLRRDNIKKLTTITSAFLLSLIPFFYFTFRQTDNISSRFLELSYMDDPIGVIEKLAIFISNLGIYWSPDFLIFHGDPNLRHSTGHGGIIYAITLLLFIVGIINIIITKKLNRFNIFLFVNLLFSPVAAALTSEGTPHALRSMLLGYYILLFSCFGLESICMIKRPLVRNIAIAFVLIFLLAESATYQLDYFLAYPARSVEAMGSLDFKSSLETAIDQNPREIIFVNEPRVTYANLQFYEYLVDRPNKPPITYSDTPKPKPGVCILYNRRNEGLLEQSEYPFTEFEGQQGTVFNGVMKVRCYFEPN